MGEITKKRKVTLVEAPPTYFGILDGDIAEDVFARFHLSARALHVLDGILRAEGWTNTEVINPLYHGNKGKFSEKNWQRILSSEILIISSITRTSPQSMEIADRYKKANPKGISIAGGADPTFRTQAWLDHVDIVVKAEGEKTLPELMTKLISDPENIKEVNGIAFKEGDLIITPPPREFLTAEELSQLPPPYYDEITREKINTGAIETSRGCPHNCDYCSVSQFYGRSFRRKSIESVIQELKSITPLGWLTAFTDDNLVGNPRRTLELLTAMKEAGLSNKYKTAQVTVTVANHPEVLKALRDVGIELLFVGIESISDATLKVLGKPYNAKLNKNAIKTLSEHRFYIHGMMIIGGDGDTPETLKETVDWAKRHLTSVQFFPPAPFPGTRYSRQMEEEGRILTKDYSLYDAQHVVVRPKNFTPYELQTTLYQMYKEFYSYKTRHLVKILKSERGLAKLASLWNFYRGGISSLNNPQTKAHLEFLKKLG